jgi:hypothetical protein
MTDPAAGVALPRETPPPMTQADYDAQLAALDAERTALQQAYTTSQTYPRWAYHATEPSQLVGSDAEALALGEGWSATPAPPAPSEPPVVTALTPPTAALGSPSFTLQVLGTGFALDAVIVWNGSDEATTVVSAKKVTTGVDMTTATVAGPVPVAVRNGDVVSNALDFTFTEATP